MSETVTSPTTLSPVTWQTAVFLLIPLAISAMTQPSGRFLTAEPRHRAYLRSIPLLCAADTIIIFIHLGYFVFSSRITFQVGLSTYVHHRFIGKLERRYDHELRHYVDYVDALDESEMLQTLYDQMWTRWVYLGLGTIWPSLKLFGLGHAPWTIAWGSMFLSSIIMTEALVLFGGRQLSRRVVQDTDDVAHQGLLPHDDHAGHGILSTDTLERLVTLREYLTIVENDLETPQDWIFILSFLAHITVLLFAAWDLKPEPQKGLNILWRVLSEALITAWSLGIAVLLFSPAFIFLVVVLFVLLSPLFLVVGLTALIGRADFLNAMDRKWASLSKKWDGLVRKYEIQFIILQMLSFLIIYLATFVGVLWFFTRDDISFFKCTLIDCGFLTLIIVLPLLISCLLSWSSSSSCNFGRKLLLMEECHCRDRLEEGIKRRKCVVDESRCNLLTIFFLNVIMLFLWYPLKYDPSGTWVSNWPTLLTGN